MSNIATQFKKGHKPTKEVIEKIKKGRIGKKHSDETRKKMSKSSRSHRGGVKLSEETKRKMSIAKKGKKASLEARMNMSRARKGKNNHLWKGGITPINKAIRKGLKYRLWREAVFERDNWTCVWCGARSCRATKVILNADHIKPFALFPELRFAIDNGRTLCFECHKKTDTYPVSLK